MDVLGRRTPVIRTVAEEKGVEPELIVSLIGLENDFTNLHAYGARGKLRRAAEKLVDSALLRQRAADAE